MPDYEGLANPSRKAKALIEAGIMPPAGAPFVPTGKEMGTLVAYLEANATGRPTNATKPRFVDPTWRKPEELEAWQIERMEAFLTHAKANGTYVDEVRDVIKSAPQRRLLSRLRFW